VPHAGRHQSQRADKGRFFKSGNYGKRQFRAIMSNQAGLEWVEEMFDLEPRWTKEPDVNIIASIARTHLGCDEGASPGVSFYAQGAFNKLYMITTPSTICFMSVSLPVDPHYKTESEVATVAFVRQNTSLPVPKTIAFDCNNENKLGFEWTLMEMMPGVPLHKRWRKMSWRAKEELVKRLVKSQARLFEHRFNKIGKIFKSESDETSGAFTLDHIVSIVFFSGDHLIHSVSRGPFTSSHDWLKARLQFVLNDQQRILDTSCDEDELEDAERTLTLAKKLLELLPTIFLPNVSASESTMLFHDDLSMNNILVDENGQLTAVLNWECVSFVPLWRACQFPRLLEERIRKEAPDKAAYASDSDEENASEDPELDNEGMCNLYWEHLEEYEMTRLRTFFLEEMQKVQPEWIAIMQASKLKADFERAVQGCDSGLAPVKIRRWIDCLHNGQPRDLWTMMHSYPEEDEKGQDRMWKEVDLC
jgi:hypothetical protein